jgi:hypothetical protein
VTGLADDIAAMLAELGRPMTVRVTTGGGVGPGGGETAGTDTDYPVIGVVLGGGVMQDRGGLAEYTVPRVLVSSAGLLPIPDTGCRVVDPGPPDRPYPQPRVLEVQKALRRSLGKLYVLQLAG